MAKHYLQYIGFLPTSTESIYVFDKACSSGIANAAGLFLEGNCYAAFRHSELHLPSTGLVFKEVIDAYVTDDTSLFDMRLKHPLTLLRRLGSFSKAATWKEYPVPVESMTGDLGMKLRKMITDAGYRMKDSLCFSGFDGVCR